MINGRALFNNKSAGGMYSAMGDVVSRYYQEDNVTDIILNPPVLGEKDGRIWVSRLGKPKEHVGFMSAEQAIHLIGLVASLLNNEITLANPSIAGRLIDGSRFQGAITASAPFWAIRKHTSEIIKLNQYVARGQMTERQRDIIQDGVDRLFNMLIVGGTGAGKSTLLMSILDYIVDVYPMDRIFGVEDTPEIRCNALDQVFTQTSPNRNMRRLVQDALRNNPKRIIIGETRGPEMLDICMAWNTGHPGGLATIHSDVVMPEAALERVEDLISMATHNPMQRMISKTINMIICISHDPKVYRRVTQIVTVHGYDRETGNYKLTAET